MAKSKTKEIPFSNQATEVGRGIWEFTTGGILWRWRKGMGLNFGPVVNGDWMPWVFINTVDQAGCFAEGYAAGYAQSTRVEKATGPADESMTDLPN